MKHFALIAAFVTIFSFFAVSPVRAQYGQYGQYGGTTSSDSILIDKQVGKPITTSKGGSTSIEYVDNLTTSDAHFQPGAEVDFKIKVKNTSNNVLDNVTVTDTLPSYIEPIEGPGTYDSNTRIITFSAGSFAPSEEKVYYLKTQLYGQDKLPTDRGLFCLTNYAKAYNNNASDDDSAQFCIEKQVIGSSQTPQTGPELNYALLAGQIALLGVGITIKKKAKQS